MREEGAAKGTCIDRELKCQFPLAETTVIFQIPWKCLFSRYLVLFKAKQASSNRPTMKLREFLAAKAGRAILRLMELLHRIRHVATPKPN